MSTTTETPPEQTAPADVRDEPLGEGGKKALEAERQANKEAKRRISELEAAVAANEAEKMTELEKAQAAAKAAEERAAAAELRALQSDIAAEFGISNDDRDLFLTGVDKETLTRQATALQERSRDASPRTPKPDLTQGRGITSKATTEDQFAAFFAEAFPH